MRCRACQEFSILSKMRLDISLGVYECPICEETVDADGAILGEDGDGRVYENIISELES